MLAANEEETEDVEQKQEGSLTGNSPGKAFKTAMEKPFEQDCDQLPGKLADDEAQQGTSGKQSRRASCSRKLLCATASCLLVLVGATTAITWYFVTRQEERPAPKTVHTVFEDDSFDRILALADSTPRRLQEAESIADDEDSPFRIGATAQLNDMRSVREEFSSQPVVRVKLESSCPASAPTCLTGDFPLLDADALEEPEPGEFTVSGFIPPDVLTPLKQAAGQHQRRLEAARGESNAGDKNEGEGEGQIQNGDGDFVNRTLHFEVNCDLNDTLQEQAHGVEGGCDIEVFNLERGTDDGDDSETSGGRRLCGRRRRRRRRRRNVRASSSSCFPLGWFEDWSRCTRWSGWGTGWAWLSCDDRCRQLNRAGGNCVRRLGNCGYAYRCECWGSSGGGGGGGGGCFPANATVRTANGRRTSLSELVVGEVLESFDTTGHAYQEPFLMDFHGQNEQTYPFLRLRHTGGGALEVSHTHLLFVPVPSQGSASGLRLGWQAVRAASLQPGDSLFTAGPGGSLVMQNITTVEEFLGLGIYSPLTFSGRLLVSDVAVSAYALPWPEPVLREAEKSYPKVRYLLQNAHEIIHPLMAPLRVGHRLAVFMGLDVRSKHGSKLHWFSDLAKRAFEAVIQPFYPDLLASLRKYEHEEQKAVK